MSIDETEKQSDESLWEAGEALLPLTGIVEALLFASADPLTAKRMAQIIGRYIREQAVRQAVEALNSYYKESGRAFEIMEIAGAFQIRTLAEYAGPVKRLLSPDKDKEKKEKGLPPAVRDTLAIVVYKQPVTKAEIQAIRGVDCSAAIRQLIEKSLIKTIGKKDDSPGQPALYGTTETFLKVYGLSHLREVPFIGEMRQLSGVEAPLPG